MDQLSMFLIDVVTSSPGVMNLEQSAQHSTEKSLNPYTWSHLKQLRTDSFMQIHVCD